MSKIIIGKHINDITINDFEYLLEGNGLDVKEFESKEQAEGFLKDMGFTDEEIHFLRFLEINEEGSIINEE